ncbi:MAG: signal recognition particle-docking protein FtsY [Anaerolineaceae bacterium]|nr:signal recognition particle-docking protein FtsY [Anaerolineaceae bacterium]
MSVFGRGLTRTRRSFFGRIVDLLAGSDVDEDTWDDIEALLIQADLGLTVTGKVLDTLRAERWRNSDELLAGLRSTLLGLLSAPPPMDLSGRPLSVVLVVGVNGTGKTTSIARLAHRMKLAGRNVILAAGDTFRAAAIEQLQTWGERIDVPVVAGQSGADPASVVFDATKAAQARGKDVLIIDTAGRLHTNANLMNELRRIRSVSAKVVPDAPHEVLLVLDGTTGQNALQQARTFQEMVDVSGVIVTKLDSSAKGGMIFAVYAELGLPVHYVGLGEGLNHLLPFSPEIFVNSLFDEN